MLESQTLLDYYASATEAEQYRDGSPIPHAACWHVPLDELRIGGLPSHTTREILLYYASRHDDSGFGEHGIPIACCIRSLHHVDANTNTNTNTFVPALLVKGILDANGTIRMADDAGAWIPSGLISGDECHNGVVSLCDIDAYCAHEVALAELPPVDTWTAAVDRAIDLFDAVNTLDESNLNELGLSLETSDCLLYVWERPNERMAIAQVLSRLSGRVADRTASEEAPEALGQPAFTILPGEEYVQTSAEQLDEVLPDDPFIAQKLLCGIPDGFPTFEQADHAALAAFAKQSHGDVLAIRTPLGTNRHAFALAAMANLLTERALRGDKAPSMACAASCESIDRMLSLLSDKPVRSQAALSTRWIPRISLVDRDDVSGAPQRRVLGSLAALALVHSADGVSRPQRGAFLDQPFAHPNGGDVALYGDSWYAPKASIHFLDCASAFLGERIHSVGKARLRLSELLRRIDQERCGLIDAYVGVCKASDLLRQRDDLVRRIGRLRRRHKGCRDRLAFWEQLLSDNPPRRILFGKGEIDQSGLIKRHAQAGEQLAQGKALIEEVTRAYRDEIISIEGNIDRLRGASTNLTRRMRLLAPEGEKCSEVIGRLSTLCRLTSEQTSLLESSIDGRGRDVTIDLLDKVLDKTIRPAEFWIAVHIYESYWIEQNKRRSMKSRSFEVDDRDITSLWGCLCPFSLVPQSTALGTCQSLTDGRRLYDLVVIVDGHETSCRKGIALSTVADRMLVMGSGATMGAPASRGATFDELWTTEAYGDGAWRSLDEANLSLSSSPSIFDLVASNSSITTMSLCDTSIQYGNLSDLRSDLIPDEPLHTHRTPANCDDDPTYALKNILPSLSYIVVPDSSWEQRGPSRQNLSESLALGRWLANHLEEIAERYSHPSTGTLALVAPFSAQAQLLKDMVSHLDVTLSERIDVLTLSEAGDRNWPLVILCATCGPDSFSQVGKRGLPTVLNTAAQIASDALVLVCGSSWARSSNEVTSAFLSRATCVGRLFSAPRTHNAQANNKPQPEQTTPLDIRLKPLALTALLRRLASRGDISRAPAATDVNRELQRRGLIERASDSSGGMGWKPTAAGHEIGILPTRDSRGNPFCAYTPESEAVVARIVESMNVS